VSATPVNRALRRIQTLLKRLLDQFPVKNKLQPNSTNKTSSLIRRSLGLVPRAIDAGTNLIPGNVAQCVGPSPAGEDHMPGIPFEERPCIPVRQGGGRSELLLEPVLHCSRSRRSRVPPSQGSSKAPIRTRALHLNARGCGGLLATEGVRSREVRQRLQPSMPRDHMRHARSQVV